MSNSLEIRGLTVRVRGVDLLREVNLSLARGEFAALLGPNGAGKTTLIRAALGLMPPAVGVALLGGEPADRLAGRERAARAAWLPQSVTISEAVTALALVSAARFRFAESHAASTRAALDALARVGAEGLASRPVTQLSGGEHQRVALAALLAQDAPLLLLDEPANHLDPAQQIAIYRLIGSLWREGRAILCVTHDVNLLRFVDADARVIGLTAGRVAFDLRLAGADLPDRFARLFGVRVRALEAAGSRLILAEDSA